MRMQQAQQHNLRGHNQFVGVQQQEMAAVESAAAGRSCPQLALILITLFLLLTAMILGVIALINPSWQIVDIREFQAEHHHGLYTDCTRAERPSTSRKLEGFVEKSPLHCTYKFDQHAVDNIEAQIHDIDSNAAAAEAEHHQFHGWQKAVLVFIGLSLLSSLLSCTMGLCAPCTPGCAVLHSIFAFFAFLFAVSAAAIFFFAAHRVDSRFVIGLVGTYEQQIGEAFYCYVISCILLMLVFILSGKGIISHIRNIKPNQKGNYIVTECGEHFHLCRPIYRQNYSGRFGYGKCMDLRDTIQPNKIHPSFVRSLRPEFAESNEIVEDLEKLIKLDHRNLIRVRDFFILPSICTNSPLIFVRFDQIQGCQSLFDRLFNQNGPLNSRQYIKWAYQAGKGLNYLMERAILHRRLNARSCLLDSLQNLRLSDFWTENDAGDFALFQSKNNNLANSTKSTAILYKDGWRYFPPETLLNGQFDSVSQVWSYSLLIWQIFTHCQFAGNRIFYSSLAEFLTITSGRDDPFYLPGQLDEKEAQKGMPEDRRRKQIFLHASRRLPHLPDSIAQIIPKALNPDRPQRPFFSQIFRVIEAEKRILDLANVLGFLL